MKKALIIGINDYDITPLNFCVNDANSIATLLETNDDESPNFEVNLRTNLKTKTEFKQLIKGLFAGDSNAALFYFSGHGFINELGGYIVTPDAKALDEGVSMDDILEWANNSKSKSRIIILDCCFSGAFAETRITGGKTLHITEGVTILTACRSVEPAWEEDGHGLFTGLLLDALKGGASDIRGNITPGSVYAYVDQALGEWGQRPVFKTNVTRFVTLRKITPLVPKEVLRKLTEYFVRAGDEFSLDPTYEWTNKEIAIPENVKKLKELQSMNRVGLLVPVGVSDMYFAAMQSKSCKLTALGYQYWRLAKNKKI